MVMVAVAVNNAPLLLAVLTSWSTANSCSAVAKALGRAVRHRPAARPLAFATGFPPAAPVPAAATKSAEDATLPWRARRDCWRPAVGDVERISWGLPASKRGKRTGSRGVPHRLDEDERRAFDRARRQGFLQVRGSAWRSQRRDAPLLNSYRSLMDARGRPATVLHKLDPAAAGGADDGDRLVIDLSPLRLPEEFARLGRNLEEKISSEFDVLCLRSDEEQIDAIDDDATAADIESEANEGDDWGTRPIYQLPPHTLSWAVSRQQGKKIGTFIGRVFDNVEDKATTSKKPRGVKPGKGRRHGGYGIG